MIFMTRGLTTLSAIGLLALSVGACSGMSTRDKNTVTGAAIGGVAGAVLTGGSSVPSAAPRWTSGPAEEVGTSRGRTATTAPAGNSHARQD
jgi:hypothetical protein